MYTSRPTRMSPENLTRIRWESLTDPRTVSAAYEGKPVRPSSFERIARAAKALGLPPPPTPTSGQQINPRGRQ